MRYRIYSFVLVIGGLLAFDFTPKFYQGDSISYLMTGMGWIPPDRSWLYGFIVNYIMLHWHGYEGYIVLQSLIFAGLVGCSQRFFAGFPEWRVFYLITAVLVCLDPVLELYVRFFMSDFMSFACFWLALVGLHISLSASTSRRRVAVGMLMISIGTLGAVFIRIAYVMIIEITMLGVALLWFRKLARRRRIVIPLGLLMPLLAALALAGTNSVLFGDRFHHSIFLNKLSGVFLAGQYAPALQPEDFANAGIPLSAEEFARLQLWNYDKRAAQVWGGRADDLVPFLQARLRIPNIYDSTLNSKARLLVRSALHRDPFAIARVYLWSAALYAMPHQWFLAINGELNLSRPLAPDFVALFNQFAIERLTPQVTTTRSPLARVYLAVGGLYPFLLALGVLSALVLLVRERRHVATVVLCAGLFGDLAAAPFYSDDVIARFILGAIFISYLTIGLAAASLFRKDSARYGSH